jgi:hypothetical protein
MAVLSCGRNASAGREEQTPNQLLRAVQLSAALDFKRRTPMRSVCPQRPLQRTMTLRRVDTRLVAPLQVPERDSSYF